MQYYNSRIFTTHLQVTATVTKRTSSPWWVISNFVQVSCSYSREFPLIFTPADFDWKRSKTVTMSQIKAFVISDPFCLVGLQYSQCVSSVKAGNSWMQRLLRAPFVPRCSHMWATEGLLVFSQRMCQHSLAAGLPVTHTVTVCDLGPVTDSRAGR